MAVIRRLICKGTHFLGFQSLAVGRINKVDALGGFSYEKKYGHFVGPIQSGHSDKVTVQCGSTVPSWHLSVAINLFTHY